MRPPFATRTALLDQLELLPGADARQEVLEARNERVAARLRARLQAGRYTRAGLHRALSRLGGTADGYDALDQLVAALLDVGDLPDPEVVLGPEMVFYQPTPARVVLALAAHLGPADVLYDLGAGLGHVVILAALLAGCDARGVELEPTFVAHARRAAAAVGASRATFEAVDARDAAFAEGTAFFMYTPFRGALLARVLARLPRGCRLYTHGPCSAEVRAIAPELAPVAL